MRIEGHLSKWNEERGFGFITPDNGGDGIFVHVSTFPKDGMRPKLGERISFEIETDSSGKKKAKHLVCLDRTSIKRTSDRNPAVSRADQHNKPSVTSRILPVLLLAGIVFFGYEKYLKHTESTIDVKPLGALTQEPSQVAFRCDGRTHCSQMTSCAEATFFLRNCPGVKMDGNGDGTPCEQQWCTGPFAK